MTDANVTFGVVLRELRNDRGLTQKELAAIAPGVSASYVALLETGNRNPSHETFESLAAALRCTAADRSRLERGRAASRIAAGASAPTGQPTVAPDVSGSAADLLAGAAELDALRSRVRRVAEELEPGWSPATAAAFTKKVGEWEVHLGAARDDLTLLASAIADYANSLAALDRTVASQLASSLGDR